MIDGLAFIGSYRAPPEYRCAQSAPACKLGEYGWLAWEGTCGRFSRVRAKKDLALCLYHVGLSVLALQSYRMSPGAVESAVWDEMLAAGKDSDRYNDLRLVRDVARRIRKPINDACDYEKERDHCLST